ncbi:ABC transporter ATP-binding protein [Coprobacter tertius]|uniref:ATP-binding cassette domain-containing protein n=1 Tax=Coprobacter tertius TaxID=2944915 RepID=A0ABT1MHV9_9BACT|nr:ATP-binding cassette domain-containing protein [Coprobacter tertius]MCP9612200.1 ATP-binding cassette domain-containing protein [Coprobacter tertius]
MYCIEAIHITKNYTRHTALEDVTVKVPQNVIYGLLGPNGAGKTSLIRIFNRITLPDKGKIFFNGHSLQDKDVQYIGYLPEERGLYKKMKVGEHIIYIGRLKGMSKNDASKEMHGWLEKFGIGEWENKRIDELSKGMQQKIQFIVTVMHSPKLLILDEPFSGFDPINANLLKSEILEFKKKGTTIIISTHNMESVEELCDEISLINHSHVILEGNVDSIRKSHKKNIFRIESNNLIPVSDNRHFHILSQLEDKHKQITFLQKDKDIRSNEILKELVNICDITAFEEILPTMNEIFIEAVTSGDIKS